MPLTKKGQVIFPSKHWNYVIMYVYTYACIYVCMYVCMCVCVYVCMHACMYVCICVCLYVCKYTCMHVYVQSWNFDLTHPVTPFNFSMRYHRYADPPLISKCIIHLSWKTETFWPMANLKSSDIASKLWFFVSIFWHH